MSGRLRREDGATTVEYGLLTAAVGVALVAVAPTLGAAFIELLELIVGGFSR